ncbi:MAG: DEAD/DEAH box helicase, partial [candidate division Zixibacteria bacterium]
MSAIKLDSPLQYLKGVGPRKAEVLAENGMLSVRDLLRYFPRRYLDRTTITAINQLQVDQITTVIGQVKAHGLLKGRKRRYEVILQDETSPLTLTFFGGLKFWPRFFEKGQVLAVTGRVNVYQGFQMVHPDLERLDEESDKMVHAGRIIPIYPQTAELTKAGLSSKMFRRLTTLVFDQLSEQLSDPLPASVVRNLKLVTLHAAIESYHYPKNHRAIESGRRRLAFDELLALQYLVFANKKNRKDAVKPHKYKAEGKRLTQLKNSLPFTMTVGQQEVVGEVMGDMQSNRPMTRLVHGDVGCGKTVVAIIAATYAAENKLQVAFMAPTEILAEQHFRNWSSVLEEIGVTANIITATLSPAEKKKRAEQAASGEIDILFGTHALIYDYVQFDNLGLVIIDEQHRFGVK